jgi:hypothetical protein
MMPMHSRPIRASAFFGIWRCPAGTNFDGSCATGTPGGLVQARQNGLCISFCTSKRHAKSCWPSSPSIANSCRERARSRHSVIISRVCRNVLVSIGSLLSPDAADRTAERYVAL